MSSNDDSYNLPPPPQGSELHARLNAGKGIGVANHSWIPISSHTAKCDLCLEHNKSVCQRCSSCNRQLCRKCIHTAHDDGVHNFNEDNLDWTPAAPIKRGPRAPLTSTVVLSITGRHASAPTARSTPKFKVYKPSAPLVPTRERAARDGSDSPARATGAGRANRSGRKRASGIKRGSAAQGLFDSDDDISGPVAQGISAARADSPVARHREPSLETFLLPLDESPAPIQPILPTRRPNRSGTKPIPGAKGPCAAESFLQARGHARSGTKRVRSDEDEWVPSTPKKVKGEDGPSTPVVSPRQGNSYFPKPVTPSTTGRLTILINSDKITKTASDKKTTRSNDIKTASNSSTAASATTSSASVTKATVAASSSSAIASIVVTSFSSSGNDGDDEGFNNERRSSIEEPATKDDVDMEDFGDDDSTVEDFPMYGAPTNSPAGSPVVQPPVAEKSVAYKPAVKDPKNPRGKAKEALEEEEREKKKAWETNEILLDLRMSGQEEDARDMLEGAYALLDLSMGH